MYVKTIKDGASLYRSIFCTVYDYADKVDLSIYGLLEFRKKIGDNGAFFRDTQLNNDYSKKQ